MSDYEKAEIMVQAIVDRYEYQAGTEEFRWNDPAGSKGDCGAYMHTVNDIFNAAGIPVITMLAQNHAWNYAYLDGEWWVVDASGADVAGDLAYAGFGKNVESYKGGPNNTDRVAMALVESAQ